ncbi:MAG TPA: class D sortase [Thermoanaerobaculia bacterium]
MQAEGGKPASPGGARRVLEWILLAAGALLLIVYAAARIHGEVGRRAGLSAFASLERKATRRASLTLPTRVDDRLWSANRIVGFKESLSRNLASPIAVLRIPKIGLEVPVLEGTDEVNLNRGVGRIEGTAVPGGAGNLGIAGHRDGFFRGLKDVARGDAITLETLSGPETYVIDDIRIVPPDDVSVLDPTAQAVLTLVTCYPFYFVGDAPQRYIVRAVRQGSSLASR